MKNKEIIKRLVGLESTVDSCLHEVDSILGSNRIDSLRGLISKRIREEIEGLVVGEESMRPYKVIVRKTSIARSGKIFMARDMDEAEDLAYDAYREDPNGFNELPSNNLDDFDFCVESTELLMEGESKDESDARHSDWDELSRMFQECSKVESCDSK